MKYFVLLLVVLCVLWLVGGSRRRRVPPQNRHDSTLPMPREMVPCQICQMHVDKDHALPGPGGFYCSPQHRKQA